MVVRRKEVLVLSVMVLALGLVHLGMMWFQLGKKYDNIHTIAERHHHANLKVTEVVEGIDEAQDVQVEEISSRLRGQQHQQQQRVAMKFSFVEGTGNEDERRQIVGERRRFKCPGESLELSFDKINDDFCDCVESGFDEPGTSACAGTKARFYCGERDQKYIPTSRVFDAICDCCDGSDEYPKFTCKNTCKALEEERLNQAAKMANGKALGAALLKKYPNLEELMKGGQSLKKTDLEQIFDTHHVALTFTDGTYMYKLKLDGLKFTQDEVHGRNSVTLGKSPSFNGVDIEFKNGQRCPNGVMRSIKVGLICGDSKQPEMTSVSELDPCVYRGFVSCPFGCLL